ncbi:MAG: hypothetical protein HOE54_10670 [Gammaproteobacteria bacterium]|nr:hypothetical protein [Gammaproteobacteria bacterium]MBT7372037.1 hypothetical protein [Gammaproteobacteria bacterium]
MTDTLFFRLRGELIEWICFNGQGQSMFLGQGSEQDLYQAIEGGHFSGQAIHVVPGEDVLLTSANIPSKQYRQVVQAAPFAVEENLAMDVEDCFFALGERNATGEIPVAVVSTDLMESWFERIANFNLDVQSIISESSLARTDASVTVVVDDGRVHVAPIDGSGVTLLCSQLPVAIAAIGDVEKIDVWVAEGAEDSIDIQIKELETGDAEVGVISSDETPFERLCRGYKASEINLLQGAYRVDESRSAGSSVWRSVALLAVCAVLLHVTIKLGQGWYLAIKAEQFEAETTTLYKEVFPQDKNVRDFRRRWNAHLGRKGSSETTFIKLFSQSAGGLTKAGLVLSNINFNENRGDLILQVMGKRSEELVQYAQRLSANGIEAEIGTITQEEDGVRGSIKIRSGGAS